MEPKSKLFNLDWKDALKGFLVAILAALLTAAYEALQAGALEFTWLFWKPVVFTALGAGMAYIIKNFLSNSDDKILTKE